MKSVPRFLFAAALTALTALSLGSCAGRTRETPVVLSGESQTRAADLYAQAESEHAADNLEAAALAVTELVNNYSGFAMMDRATFLAGEIASGRGQHDHAARYFQAVVNDYPLSPLWPAAALSSAQEFAELGMYVESAETLIRLLDSPLEESLRETTEMELRSLVRSRLGPSDLETLAQKHPASPINREIAVRLARKEYARGDYDAAYELLAEFLYRFPEDEQSSEARLLLELAAEKRQAPVETPPTVVEPNTIGAILPVTGPGQMSLFARYFDEGLRMAVDEFNRSNARQARLITADTKGSPVGAVKAVRKLVLEDGAVGLVGSVFTMPTFAAAIEANAWRTPLLSPVVSVDDLLEIGPWVFETKVPQEVEVAAIAGLAVTGLLHERIAIVAPERGRRREAADLFAAEVARLGAEVVEAGYYEEGATDFREQLEAVREAAPDALFLPGGVEDLLNLLPQVKFYDLQLQLLGLSDWNNDNLLRLFRSELEGALFPLETYHGKDPEAYQRLKAVLEEQGTVEVSPVTVAGYFGMKLILESLQIGASNREEVRAFLEGQLSQGAEARLAEAEALTILTVRSGRVREFEPPPRPQTGF